MASEKKYSIKEIAQLEEVSPKTVYGWCASGDLESEKRPGAKGSRVVSAGAYEKFKAMCKARGVN